MSYMSYDMICCAKPILTDAWYILHMHMYYVYTAATYNIENIRYPQGIVFLATDYVRCRYIKLQIQVTCTIDFVHGK
jgi:hypothetical protein